MLSIRQACVAFTLDGLVQSAPFGPRVVNVSAYPTVAYVVEKLTCDVFRVRTVLAAADSLAAIRDRRRLGMAMAAMIRMIATTIRSSMSEKPFCLRIFTRSSKFLSPGFARLQP